ncbi:MAG: hypothetical protein IRY85_20925 [Micromonosporaceae bacterium]|nr:hypothetical protein [Micromonosporaceae bacterium]
MRRPLVAVLLAAALTATAAACAHPQNIAPKPGETTTTTRANTPTTARTTTAGTDETEQVCAQATSTSKDAVDQLTDKLEQAQTAANAGNNAGALAAASEARRIATDWKSDLTDLARRPIRADVRTTLENGIATIDRILTTNPQNLDPRQAERDVRGFLEDLDRVCS